MRLQPFVDRLKGAGLPHVYGVMEFAGLKAAPAGQSFYVVPEREAASPNTLAGQHAIDQKVDQAFMVVIVLPAAARRAEAISEALEDAVQAVIRAVAGWTHPDASRACELAGGRLLSADGSMMAWGVTFRTAWRLRLT